MNAPAILILSETAVVTARTIAAALPEAEILGLESRVRGADGTFAHFGDAIRTLYEEDRPIVALCAAGIVIRALAPLLQDKRSEPPVLAVVEDGSAVVPLLGGLSGVNDVARAIAAALDVAPAITTSGELRFGINLLYPPADLVLANPGDAKRFMSDLLAGEKLRLDGEARWLAGSRLPFAENGRLVVTVTAERRTPKPGELIYHPVATSRGKLTVIGLGPGARDLMTPAARHALERADDILGYETYVRMAGPFHSGQALHMTDNREEMQRARQAFELAASGRSVAMVSSGDPGIFAMAAAVVEALHESENTAWHGVELAIEPGISAAFAAAARAGAPLGHDFCILSLSDNLKPWQIIEKRLRLAAEADLAMALYNPISKARPWQLGKALELAAEQRSSETPVLFARAVGRPDESLRILTLAEAVTAASTADMATLVMIGASSTRLIAREDRPPYVYTPRSAAGPRK